MRRSENWPQTFRLESCLIALLKKILVASSINEACRFSRQGNAIHVVVFDTGVGFELALVGIGAAAEGGFGLFGIRRRLELLGGHMTVESAPGQGSRFTRMAPLRLPDG